jgi:ubiquinone/menaquinone biosynthesis C-methylase UbiE
MKKMIRLKSEEEFINFDPFASAYDFSRAISEDTLKLFFASFLEINNKEGKLKDILEIGCGTGRVSRIFAVNNFNLTGIDVSENMLKYALIKAQEEHWSFKGIVADARSLPFKDLEFDIAFTVHVLHLIKDWKQVISEALRCVKTKRFVNVSLSREIFSTPTMKNYWKYLKENAFLADYETDKKLGAQNDDEIVEYFKSLGYGYEKSEFSNKVKISKKLLIDITKSKSFSSQRFLSDELHNKALFYLEENDYFLPKDADSVEVVEKGRLYSFYKK